MAGGNKKLEELKTLDAMVAKSNEYPNKIIAVLFNVPFPDRGTIEPKLVWWRQSFEKDHNVLFYKYVCSRDNKALADSFQINMTPAFIFFHAGEQAARLDNLNETKADYIDTAKPGEDSADEKSVKEKIKELCNTRLTNKPNSDK